MEENQEYEWIFDEDQQKMLDEIKASMKINQYKTAWKSDIEKMPSIEEYHKGFQKLIDTDFSNSTVEEIEIAFRKYSIIFENAILFVPRKTINLLTAFRVRDVGPNEDLSNPKTFSYPPEEYSKKNERLNIKGFPVFYCGDHKATGFLESKMEGKSIKYFACFSVHADHDIWASFLISPDLKTKNRWITMGKQQMNFAIEKAKLNGGNKAAHLVLLYDFMNWIVENEHPPYHISSWLGHYLFYKSHYDMIVYTSKQTDGHQCNIAFRPKFVDKYIRLEVVFKVLVSRTENELVVELQEVGELVQDQVVWRSPNDNDELFFESSEPIVN
jgi:hypothetical protein